MALVPHRYTHFDSDLEDYTTDTNYYWADCTQEDVAKFGPDAIASYIVNGKVSPEATKLFKHDAAGEITLGSIALSMCVAGGLAYSSVSSMESHEIQPRNMTLLFVCKLAIKPTSSRS